MSEREIQIRVSGLDCENEAAAIDRGLRGHPGISRVRVYARSAKVVIGYEPGETTPKALKDKLGELGFPEQAEKGAGPPKVWQNPKVLASAASGVLLAAGWSIGRAGAPPSVSLGLYIASMIVGGYYFGREALTDLFREREIGIELLMTVAAVVAAVMGQAAEGAMLAFLYSMSEAAEGYTEEKTRAAVKALMDLAPKTALVRRDGAEVSIPVEEVQVGDLFLVKPGESIATDGAVKSGTSSVNQAPITGESAPVDKGPGDKVFAGTINGNGSLEVEASKTFAENTIARIVHLVEEAQEKKGKGQRLVERFGKVYSPLVLLAGVVIAAAPPLLFDAAWRASLLRATVFIVAAAPCALAIAIPITFVAALGTAARRGVLIKGGVYLDELAKITVVALDKTGTLTEGEPEVIDVVLFEPAGDGGPGAVSALLAIAAGIERFSEHPLARAIVRDAAAKNVAPAEVTDFRAVPGAGAEARSDGLTVYAGSPDFFASRLRISLDHVQSDIERLQLEAKTVVLIGSEKTVWGLLAIRDAVRPAARRALHALHEAGIQKVVMLTGDNERTAGAIAKELGIDEVYADMKPEDKLTKIRELKQRHGHIAMVGDGVNDAPALAEATVGVAMGAAGTDVALETADVALMGDDLEKLAYAFHLAKRTRSVVRQNLALSLAVISVLVVGAVLGRFSLPVAVLGHELSELLVIASGLRMLRG